LLAFESALIETGLLQIDTLPLAVCRWNAACIRIEFSTLFSAARFPSITTNR